jgi:anti-sigma factor RsiW
VLALVAQSVERRAFLYERGEREFEPQGVRDTQQLRNGDVRQPAPLETRERVLSEAGRGPSFSLGLFQGLAAGSEFGSQINDGLHVGAYVTERITRRDVDGLCREKHIFRKGFMQSKA